MTPLVLDCSQRAQISVTASLLEHGFEAGPYSRRRLHRKNCSVERTLRPIGWPSSLFFVVTPTSSLTIGSGLST
jgi:hypothetical protein